jgi:hypothetical protein
MNLPSKMKGGHSSSDSEE